MASTPSGAGISSYTGSRGDLKNQIHLLFSRRFLPLFATQFLGAFNDNLFKNALVIMIMYAGLQVWGVSSGVLVVAAGGIFILPFFLFSSLAGQLADKYEKSAIIRLVKAWEILLMLLAAMGFYTMNPALLLGVLFLMGTQSTFFGPIKYSILPNHLQRDELIAGNALIEAATFVAILLGTIGGGVLIAMEGGANVVSAGLLLVALAGLATSLFVPRAPAPAAGLKIGWNVFAESWNIINIARSSRPVFLSILGISWFWLIGAVFLSTLPVYVKDIVGGTEGVVTLFLTMFSVGTGLGSLLCNKLLKGEIDTRYVPLGAFGMTMFGLDLCLASLGLPIPAEGAIAPMTLAPMTVAQFLSHLVGWRISLDLFMIAACGGLFIVPLYAVMQTRCKEEERARVIAANNIMNALFMVVSAGGAAAIIGSGLSPVFLFLVVSLLNGGAYFIIRSLALESGDKPVLRFLLKIILKAIYQIRVRGMEHVASAGGNVMIVANHQSFLDGVLMGVFFPGRYSFVVNRFMAGRW
ncbi:MAG: MFS transporter, partial [Nitrospinota bacterium]|nr:MFS transporter [Nitrospinota bacterium]